MMDNIFRAARLVVGTLLLLTSVALAAEQNQVAFDPAGQTSREFLLDGFKVKVTPGSPVKLQLSREKNDRAPSGRLSLPPEMAQVDDMIGTQAGTAITIGRVNGSVSEVVLVKLVTATITDVFWCYKPSVSPDHQLVAYVKFYPPHFVEGVTDEYMLYDTGKTPSENRVGVTEASDKKNVGRVLFPEGVMNGDNDNVGRSADQIHRCMSRTLFWSPDGRRLLFLDENKGSSALVLVQVEGKPDPKYYVGLTTDLCPDHKCSPFLDGVTFSPKGELLLDVKSSDRASQRTLIVPEQVFTSPK